MARSRKRRGKELTRRVFIHRMTFLGGGVVLLGAACKRDEQPPKTGKRPPPPGVPKKNLTTSHRTFTDEEFAILSAAVERILPTDEDPGAAAAGVPEYIDRMLQSPELVRMKEDFVPGVGALDRRSERMFKAGFLAATPAQQDELLAIFRDSPPGTGEAHFFELLTVLTLEGFLGDPSYGGNKDKVGWALVGFGTSEPPMGHDGMKALHTHDHLER